MVRPLAAALLLWPLAAGAQTLAELREKAAGQKDPVGVPVAAAAAPARRACKAGWEARREGGCWGVASFGNGNVPAFVHAAGWVVDERCFADPRFTGPQLLAALDVAARKLDPARPLEDGGCLGTYNPAWARELKDLVWTKRVRVTCPPERYLGNTTFCANAGPLELGSETFQLITIAKVKDCMGPDTSGLAGVMLHETLHAAGADNTSRESHNLSWRRGQLEFVRDRVYGTEALCFLERKNVNFLQCVGASDDRVKCQGMSMSFTDMPMGAVKH